MPTQYLAFRNTCCYTSQFSHKPDVINQLANHHQPAFLPKLFFHQLCMCSFTMFHTNELLFFIYTKYYQITRTNSSALNWDLNFQTYFAHLLGPAVLPKAMCCTLVPEILASSLNFWSFVSNLGVPMEPFRFTQIQ